MTHHSHIVQLDRLSSSLFAFKLFSLPILEQFHRFSRSGGCHEFFPSMLDLLEEARELDHQSLSRESITQRRVCLQSCSSEVDRAASIEHLSERSLFVLNVPLITSYSILDCDTLLLELAQHEFFVSFLALAHFEDGLEPEVELRHSDHPMLPEGGPTAGCWFWTWLWAIA
jgi:hypothetical protein